MHLRIAAALFLFVCASCPTAWANTITVDAGNSGSVVGKCTLQDAVTAANTNAAVNGCVAGAAGLDTIVFAPGITSIGLASAMTSANPACTFGLAVTEDLTIDGGAVAGSGVPKVTIERSFAPGTANFGVIGASLYNCGTSPTTKLNLTLSGVEILNGNNAGSNGGGVAADILTVHDGVITGNLAANGGGIYAFSSLTMTSSKVSNNSVSGSGGGIAGDVPMTISGSTINANNGVSIYGPSSTIAIDNSTISGNAGGGIDTGFIAAYFVTITANTGPGIYLEVATVNNSVAEFDDSVIVGNGSPPTVNDLQTSASRPITGTFNYIGSLSTVALNDLDVGVRIASCASLNLGLLANNGGGTQTHALLAGSCLIDAGGTVSPGGLSFTNDQRGNSFPRFVNTHADIGAFEYQGGATPLPSTTALVSSLNPAGSGQSVTFTATVTGSGATPTGSVTFKDAGVTFGSGSLNASGQATFATSSLTAGNHAITAVYAGDTAYAGSTSNTVNQDITTTLLSSTTTLTDGPAATTFGQSITFTATVTGGGVPSGSVDFKDGGVTFANALLNAASQATFTTSTLAVGTHAITAVYAGNSAYAGSTSNALSVTVAPQVIVPGPAPVAAPALSAWALSLLVLGLALIAWAARNRAGQIRND